MRDRGHTSSNQLKLSLRGSDWHEWSTSSGLWTFSRKNRRIFLSDSCHFPELGETNCFGSHVQDRPGCVGERRTNERWESIELWRLSCTEDTQAKHLGRHLKWNRDRKINNKKTWSQSNTAILMLFMPKYLYMIISRNEIGIGKVVCIKIAGW